MPDCDDPVRLQGLLRELAASAPGPRTGVVESRLRSVFHARRRRRRFFVAGSGLAACFLAALGWGWGHASRQAAAAEPDFTGFIALPYAQSDVPMEQVIVVRVKLQAGDLRALGLPPGLLTGRSATGADLLMGQDGIARAVRFAE